MLGDLGGEFDLRRSANQFVGRRLKESRINSRFLLGSYHERTLRVLLPSEILELKKESEGFIFLILVNLVYTNWNYLVSDFYRIKGIATVLYPTSYIPSVSRTGSY